MIDLHGQFKVTCRDSNGRVKWQESFPNGVTNAGKNYVLDSALAGGTVITSWFIGLIDGTQSATLAAGDTLASHAGWSELTSYDEAARQAWTAGTVSGQAVSNSALPATFTFTTGTTVSGLLLASDSTKGGTTGTLYSTALFSAAKQPADGDSLEVSYSISAGG